MIQYHGSKEVVMGIGSDGRGEYQYKDGTPFGGDPASLTLTPTEFQRISPTVCRDWYLEGEWGMRSLCPWKSNRTQLGHGYLSEEEANLAKQWNEAAHPKQGARLTVVMRQWTTG